MNGTEVLKKIMTMLSAEQKRVKFTYAKLADGTVVESPTFDVGEPVEVVTEEGKSPAPDGTHELALKDSEGNDVLIKVKTEGGVIVERENVELPSEEEKEVEEEMASIAGEDIGSEESDDEDEEVLPIPQDMAKKMQDLAYRIEEMEKRITKMEEEFPPVDEKKVTEGEGAETVKAAPLTEEMNKELPKLDGAPIDSSLRPQNKFAKIKAGKVVNPQASFLSKLYN